MANITINQDSLKPRREFKRHQIQPGHNIYRILPPFGEESLHNNYPYKRWSLAWLVDPKSGRRKPFALPPFEKDNPDPVSKYVKLLADKLDKTKKAAIENLVSKGVPQEKAEEKVREKLADANKLVWELRPKNGYFYNACNKAGEVGILELKKTAHDGLKAAMYEYIKDYSQDPTSLSGELDDSGVWFDVERVGEKGDKDTEYKVNKSQTKRKNERGVLVFEDDREPLPEHVVQNYSKLGYDIYGLYQAKTHEELYAILMFNLKDIVANNPVARVEGFDPDLFNFDDSEKSTENNQEPPFEVEPPVKGKAPVKLAGMTEEDDVEVDLSLTTAAAPTVAAKPVAKTIPAAKVAESKPVTKPALADDDIVAMAESFLNS